MRSKNIPLSQKENIVTQELNGELLIYNLTDNKAFCLNETSALIWQMCDGNKSVNEISESLSRKLNQPANEDLVWLAIEQLRKEKLIANGEELVSNLEGMSRREVIKKVGLGTMIALPIVSGIIAPTSAQAASAACVAPSCTCTSAPGAEVPVGDICTPLAGRGCTGADCTVCRRISGICNVTATATNCFGRCNVS